MALGGGTLLEVALPGGAHWAPSSRVGPKGLVCIHTIQKRVGMSACHCSKSLLDAVQLMENFLTADGSVEMGPT